jgi:hypothetical protein
MTLIASLSNPAIPRLCQPSRSDAPSHPRPGGAKDLEDGGFADARGVRRFFEDGGNVLASELPIAARKLTRHWYQLAGNLLRGSQWMLEGKSITLRIETMTNLSDQVPAVASLAGDPSVISSSSSLP